MRDDGRMRVTAKLKITGSPTRSEDPWDKISKPAYGDKLPFVKQDTRAMTAEGKTLEQKSSGLGGSRGTWSLTVTFANPEKKAIKSIDLRCVEKYFQFHEV